EGVEMKKARKLKPALSVKFRTENKAFARQIFKVIEQVIGERPVKLNLGQIFSGWQQDKGPPSWGQSFGWAQEPNPPWGQSSVVLPGGNTRTNPARRGAK